MDYGTLQYRVQKPGSDEPDLRLTLVSPEDEATLRVEGLAVLRRRRIVRLTGEAVKQGGMLGYEDLVDLLLTSLATLKRDIGWLEKNGHYIRLRGRRKNGVPWEDRSEG